MKYPLCSARFYLLYIFHAFAFPLLPVGTYKLHSVINDTVPGSGIAVRYSGLLPPSGPVFSRPNYSNSGTYGLVRKIDNGPDAAAA